MRGAFLCLTLLLVNTLAFNIFVNKRQDDASDKVQVDFFYESLCPYCQQFMERSLKTAANTKDFWKICDFRLFPYGNARRQRNGTDDWTFTCQHGVRECQGNAIEACAIKLNEDKFYSNVLPFVICLEGNSNDWVSQGKKCSTQYGLNWEDISRCSESKQGRNFVAEFADATDKLQPAHTYVPWVVVNNAHSTSTENAVQSNMVKYVCSIYKGTEKIAACG